MAVLAKIFQVTTHETERFMLWSFFELVDPFYCFLVEDIATDTVNSIGGVTDNPAPAQMICDPADQP